MSKSTAEKEALGHELITLCFKSELNSNDIRSIIRCVAEEADTNIRDKWGHTSLMYASRDGHSDVVHELLARGGADPNLANRCNQNHLTQN
jgi:ankyrin repeat protein